LIFFISVQSTIFDAFQLREKLSLEIDSSLTARFIIHSNILAHFPEGISIHTFSTGFRDKFILSTISNKNRSTVHFLRCVFTDRYPEPDIFARVYSSENSRVQNKIRRLNIHEGTSEAHP